MKDIRWTIRNTECLTKGVRLFGRPNHCWREDTVGKALWTRKVKDRESWRTGKGLLPTVEGQPRIEIELSVVQPVFNMHAHMEKEH